MKRLALWPLVIVIGLANAALLFVFELIGVNLTNWLWNSFFHTDTTRWLVVPVAVLLGLALTWVIRGLRGQRVVSPKNDLLEEMQTAPTTLAAIAKILTIGAASLLAGASLGPEASLMSASTGIGGYSAEKWRFKELKQLLILASVGALLVAFIGSYVLVLVPLLLLLKGAKQQGTRPKLSAIVAILLAGLTSLGMIEWLDHLNHKTGGYGTAPTLPPYVVHDFITALILGFVAGFLATCLDKLIEAFWRLAVRFDKRKLPAHDWLVGEVFGLVLGIIYLFSGRTAEFSGSIGSHLLVSDATHYGALALLGLIVTKLLATAWSKGTGYRGGLVFPSLYTGVALGLLASHLLPSLAGSGLIVGSVSGMLTAAVGTPIMAGVFLIAFLPLHFWPLALVAIIGTITYSRTLKRRLV